MNNIIGKNISTLRIAILWMIIVLMAGIIQGCQSRPAEITEVQSVGLAGQTDVGFDRVTAPLEFSFPKDHGPHLGYQTEWWYYTGNLQTAEGQRFGYQLTFFRRALVPPTKVVDTESAWRTSQVYFAHFAISDIAGKNYQYAERFSRGAAGLAGAEGEPVYSVWLEDWSVQQLEDGTYQLQAATDEFGLNLRLVDQKGPILQGDRGYSPKGPEPGNASAYVSQTRLAASGEVILAGTPFSVNGWSWMDHEFSTSALAEGQVGWDWFSIQLDDGSELMLFTLRREDGTTDPFSAGTWIAPDGSTQALARDDFDIRPTAEWRSPHSGAVYPAAWQVTVPALDLELTIEPLMSDQELNLSFVYWEGAVNIQGRRNGQPVNGFGYVELTGYAKSMQGQF